MLIALERIIINIMTLYLILTIIYIFMSWFPNARETSFGKFVGRVVEPYLAPFRQIVPSIGMIDLSPLVAIFVLNLAMSGVSFLFRMIG